MTSLEMLVGPCTRSIQKKLLSTIFRRTAAGSPGSFAAQNVLGIKFPAAPGIARLAAGLQLLLAFGFQLLRRAEAIVGVPLRDHDALRAAGWNVLTFWGGQIVRDAEGCARQIIDALNPA